jgi:hypothetical protein
MAIQNWPGWERAPLAACLRSAPEGGYSDGDCQPHEDVSPRRVGVPRGQHGNHPDQQQDGRPTSEQGGDAEGDGREGVAGRVGTNVATDLGPFFVPVKMNPVDLDDLDAKQQAREHVAELVDWDAGQGQHDEHLVQVEGTQELGARHAPRDEEEGFEDHGLLRDLDLRRKNQDQ